MKKITKNAINALMNKTYFNSRNTQVKFAAFENGIPVQMDFLLHGNLICSYHNNKRGVNKLIISNCGWFTNTTKERLNGLPGVNIYQKNYVWYLNGKIWNGKPTEINLNNL